MLMDCRKLKELIGIESGEDFLEIDERLWKNNGDTICVGVLNPFYGKKHTEETKKIIRNKMLKMCEEPDFLSTRSIKGEKNGMYGSKRFGELNPMHGKKHSKETKEKISLKAKERYKNGFVSSRKGKKLSDDQKNKISERNSKKFKIKDPGGTIIEITNLSDYCKKNNLNFIMMSRVSRGISKKHKGYTTP